MSNDSRELEPNLKTFLPVRIVVHRDSHGKLFIEEDDCRKLGSGLRNDESMFVYLVNYSQVEGLKKELQHRLDEWIPKFNQELEHNDYQRGKLDGYKEVLGIKI